MQDQIAVVVSQGVVDLFEVIEIHDDKCQGLSAANRREYGLMEAIRKQCAIRQVGERVVQGLIFDGRHLLLALGDIAGDTDKIALLVQPHFADGEIHGKYATVLALAHDLATHSQDARLARADVFGKIAVVFLGIRRGHQPHDILAAQLLRRVTEYLEYRLIRRLDYPFLVDGDDRVHHVVHHCPDTRLAGDQLFLHEVEHLRHFTQFVVLFHRQFGMAIPLPHPGDGIPQSGDGFQHALAQRQPHRRAQYGHQTGGYRPQAISHGIDTRLTVRGGQRQLQDPAQRVIFVTMTGQTLVITLDGHEQGHLPRLAPIYRDLTAQGLFKG